MRKNLTVLVLLATTLSACATSHGFDRGVLRDQLSAGTPATEAEIARVQKLKPQLPKPFKVALFLNENEQGRAGWRWTEEDKEAFMRLGEELRAKKIASQAFLINTAIAGGSDLKSLRLAAARLGADALLIVSANVDHDRYNNNWALSYIALVPALFVPGSIVDTIFVTRATLWDVRNEYLYLTTESESVKSQTRPAAFIDERTQTEAAKLDALNALRADLLRRLDEMNTR